MVFFYLKRLLSKSNVGTFKFEDKCLFPKLKLSEDEVILFLFLNVKCGYKTCLEG